MTAEPTLDDIVTHKELAEFLGISERSLSCYRIRHIELGRQRLYFRQAVVEYLRRREQGPTLAGKDD
jgi:hypothetical protein